MQANQGDKIFKELQGLKNNDYRDIEKLIKKYIDPKLTFGKFMTEFRAALLLKESTGLRGFKGISGFNSIKTQLYSGNGKKIRGGGAVVKQVKYYTSQLPINRGKNVTFTFINTSKPKLSKPSITLSSGNKKAYIKWKKIAGANGYEIYRATSKSGKYSKIKTITSGSTTSYTNSKLTSKKTYYYKMRAYKNVSGKKVYSSFSAVKYIKIK